MRSISQSIQLPRVFSASLSSNHPLNFDKIKGAYICLSPAQKEVLFTITDPQFSLVFDKTFVTVFYKDVGEARQSHDQHGARKYAILNSFDRTRGISSPGGVCDGVQVKKQAILAGDLFSMLDKKYPTFLKDSRRNSSKCGQNPSFWAKVINEVSEVKDFQMLEDILAQILEFRILAEYNAESKEPFARIKREMPSDATWNEDDLWRDLELGTPLPQGKSSPPRKLESLDEDSLIAELEGAVQQPKKSKRQKKKPASKKEPIASDSLLQSVQLRRDISSLVDFRCKDDSWVVKNTFIEFPQNLKMKRARSKTISSF
jgi:hypothetical protein